MRNWNDRGRALSRRGRYEEALACYDQALALRPDTPEVLSNRGNALRHLGRLDEAEASYRQALRLKPDFANAHSNFGKLLLEQGRYDEAEARLQRVVLLQPEAAGGYHDLGHLYYRLGRAAESQESFRAALLRQPDNPALHTNLSHALLLAGRLEEGWKEFEWRLREAGLAAHNRRFAVPCWDGSPIGERVMLLHAEQGLGDTLQFCRYVPRIAAGAKTILEVQRPLERLLSRLPGIIRIVSYGDPLPPHDLHCSLLSLPHVLGTTLDNIPRTTPYLAADPTDAARWRAKLAGLRGLRVGLCWAGGKSPNNPGQVATDARRSISLATLAPLAGMAGVCFVSLQLGAPAAEASRPPDGFTLYDFTAGIRDFADTAALIAGLDLVISVDTAVAHLAGALDKPVWLLNRFDTCFRWLQDRDDSPWYPRLRQFRQPAPGDWRSVIAVVGAALNCLTARQRG